MCFIVKLVSSFVAFYILLEMALSAPDGECLPPNLGFRLEVVPCWSAFRQRSKVSLETLDSEVPTKIVRLNIEGLRNNKTLVVILG